MTVQHARFVLLVNGEGEIVNACMHVYVCLYRESMCVYMCVYRDRVCVCILRTCVYAHVCTHMLSQLYHYHLPLTYCTLTPGNNYKSNCVCFPVPPLLGLVHIYKYWYTPFEVMVCYCSN